MADVDAVIVNWNGRDQTAAAVESLLQLREVRSGEVGLRVIVSDNGSADGSVALLRERFGERIAIVQNGENLGFGAGVNRAAAAADSPLLFLLNPDAAVRDGALACLRDFMKAHPRCALAGPKIFETDGSLAQSCGEFDTWTGAFLRSSAWGEWPFLRKYANGASLRAFAYDAPRSVDLVIGAALMIRRDVFEQLGGFDERFFMYHEEVDLAKRAADAGYQTWFVPSAVATHAGMSSAGPPGDSAHRINVERWKTASRRRYWIKHHGYTWYYALSAALAGRYVLYLAVLAAFAYGVKRALFR